MFGEELEKQQANLADIMREPRFKMAAQVDSVAEEMSQQIEANCVRIGILDEQNKTLNNTLVKMQAFSNTPLKVSVSSAKGCETDFTKEFK